MNYETASEIEIAVAEYFGIRRNLIVPNVSWGLSRLHECDLLIMTPSNHLYEVEIKVSKSDLIADKKKIHGHVNNRIKLLYFAIPEKLMQCTEHIPERAGILVVMKDGTVRKCREAKANTKSIKASNEDRLQLLRLGAMRIWGLKRRLQQAESNYRNLLPKIRLDTPHG